MMLDANTTAMMIRRTIEVLKNKYMISDVTKADVTMQVTFTALDELAKGFESLTNRVREGTHNA